MTFFLLLCFSVYRHKVTDPKIAMDFEIHVQPNA